MSDYRDPNDPYTRNIGYEPYSANTKSGWIWLAAAVFLVIALVIAFGAGHEPNRVASNNSNTMTPSAAPTTPAPATNPVAPGLTPPPGPAPAAAPNRP